MDYDLYDIIEIKNILGETILVKNLEKDINPMKLDVNNLQTGVYSIVFRINNEWVTKKLIIQ